MKKTSKFVDTLRRKSTTSSKSIKCWHFLKLSLARRGKQHLVYHCLWNANKTISLKRFFLSGNHWHYLTFFFSLNESIMRLKWESDAFPKNSNENKKYMYPRGEYRQSVKVMSQLINYFIKLFVRKFICKSHQISITSLFKNPHVSFKYFPPKKKKTH